jgi:hypothetical protein
MTKTEQIKAFALGAVGCAYIYGATGQLCTPEYRQARMAQYPKYADVIRRTCPALKSGSDSCEGCRYKGRKAYDCAQLTRYAAKAAGLTLPSGASSQWKKGDWAQQGTIDTLPRDQVCFVYMERADSNPMGHTGVYLGDGMTVDARGHSSGVVHQALKDKAWTHWAVLRGQDGAVETLPTLRQGSTGESVKHAQTLLSGLGYDIGSTGADGIFGAKTAQAVKAFQRDAGLNADGVIGAETWTALDKQDQPADVLPDPEPVEPTDAEKLDVLWEWYKKEAGS